MSQLNYLYVDREGCSLKIKKGTNMEPEAMAEEYNYLENVTVINPATIGKIIIKTVAAIICYYFYLQCPTNR